MGYLEDNTLLAKELKGTAIKINEQSVGRGNTMETFSGGRLVTGFGLEIPVAVKKFVKEGESSLYAERNVIRFARSLGCISLIHDRLPELATKLPLFYLMFTDGEGAPLGQVTEDFSEGGEHYVGDYPFLWRDRPAEANDMSLGIESMLKARLTEKASDETRLVVNDDFTERMLNDVSGMGPRLVDLFGEPITFDVFKRVSIRDKQALAGTIDNVLGADQILQDIAAHSVELSFS